MGKGSIPGLNLINWSIDAGGARGLKSERLHLAAAGGPF